MKTKTITALEQALSDLSINSEPRREDEFTATEMLGKLNGIMSLSVIQRRLRDMVQSGAYSRRPMGRDFLYRKV